MVTMRMIIDGTRRAEILTERGALLGAPFKHIYSAIQCDFSILGIQCEAIRSSVLQHHPITSTI